MIIISFHSVLRLELGCKQMHIELDQERIEVLLRICEEKLGHPFVDNFITESEAGSCHRPMILLNGRSIRVLQGFETVAFRGDHVSLLPLCGGG